MYTHIPVLVSGAQKCSVFFPGLSYIVYKNNGALLGVFARNLSSLRTHLLSHKT